jgi:tRNA (cytidine/uridine-2'-O-)-methyltransferase
MFHLVFYHPEIPPNTGNAMRLAANTGCTLHLIEPLGFTLDDTKLRRAGMDYRDRAVVRVYPDLDSWHQECQPNQVFAFAKQGSIRYTDVSYQPADALLFGSESVGLPDEVLSAPFVSESVFLPMRPGLRSLNLSNSAAIAVFEAWRQNGFSRAER